MEVDEPGLVDQPVRERTHDVGQDGPDDDVDDEDLEAAQHVDRADDGERIEHDPPDQPEDRSHPVHRRVSLTRPVSAVDLHLSPHHRRIYEPLIRRQYSALLSTQYSALPLSVA